jgi:cell division protein FtsA
MAHPKTLVALDIGSSKIRTVVGVVEDKRNVINVIGVGLSPSNGVRKGMITDIEEAISNITSALEDAERMSGEHIHRLFVGFSGPHIETFDSKGVIAINSPNSEITEDDVDRVLDAARAVSLPSNREILRIIPKNFSIDAQQGIKYPVGMTGIRLEVQAHIISSMNSSIRNLEKCLVETGVDIEDIVPSSLACVESVLDKKQKELGVVMIEIGACSTNVAVYEEGTIVHSCVIPVGGEHVTNDLAIGLRSAIETAEKVKIEYGTCIPDDVSDREQIDLSEISKVDAHTVTKKEVSKIIEARYHEIFMMIRDELSKVGKDGMLPAGVVLCGGAIKMPGVVDLARECLQLPVQIGSPKNIEGIVDRIDDPSFISVIGLLHFGNRYGSEGSFMNFDFKKVFSSFGDLFKKLIP